MKKPERFVVVGDNHGDHECRKASAVFFDFLKAWKPTVRIHNGDCWDFAALRKGATDDEKQASLGDDIAAGAEFMRRLRPTHVNFGNHDARIFDALDSKDGPLVDLAARFVDEIHECVGDAKLLHYGKRKVLVYGDTTILHGVHSGASAAKQVALTYGKSIMNHVHRFDTATVPRLKDTVGHTNGAMCELDQRYNRAQAGTLAQAQGWLYGLKLASGELIIYQAKKHGSAWYLPTEFRRIEAA